MTPMDELVSFAFTIKNRRFAVLRVRIVSSA